VRHLLVAKFLKRGRAEEGASFGQCLNACGEIGLRQTNIRLSQDFSLYYLKLDKQYYIIEY